MSISVQIGVGMATEGAMGVVATWFFDDFFEFFATRHPTIHHHDDDLTATGGDSDDDLTHITHNNLDVHGDDLDMVHLPFGPSPTPHISSSCARHCPTLLMLTTYLIKFIIKRSTKK